MIDFLEKHYTVAELAKAWHVSPHTIRPWFLDEPGVIHYGSEKLKRGRKRAFRSLRIPASVAEKVYRRHTRRELQPANGT